MASFVDDVARIRDVLQANAVDKVVDEGIINALLELYATDNQRVDLVLLDLEGMLGKTLSVGAQQQRWEELQRQQGPEVVEVERRLNNPSVPGNQHLVPIHDDDTEDLIQLSPPSTSGHVNQPQFTEMTNTNTPTSHNNNLRKRLTAVRRSPVPNQGPQNSNTNNGSAGVTAVKAEAVAGALTGAFTEVSSLAGPSGSLSKEASTATREEQEEQAIDIHNSILSLVPFLHVKFAAFKAAEFAMLKNSLKWLNEFVTQCLSGQLELVVRAGQPWEPSEESDDAEQLRIYHIIFEHFVRDRLEFLVRAVPEADPDFLEQKARAPLGDQEAIGNFVTQALEGTVKYPSRSEYNKRKQYQDLADKFFTVEEFLELYDDPLKHFSDETRNVDGQYREEALNQLKSDFRFASVVIIRRVFQKHRCHYTPTYFELKSSDTAMSSRKTKRSATECMRTKAKDVFLLQELAFVRIQKDIDAFFLNKNQMRLDAVEQARKNGTLIDCPICCEDELVELDLIQCPMGHGICRNCVRRQTEEQIGLMKNHVRCLVPDCTTEYALESLKEVLGKSTFKRLEKRRQAEEILSAGIEGLESCPFCDYCQVPRETDKLFQCQNPECSKVSCRECRESNHLPLRCEEHAMKQRLNNYVESRMTEALLRECPKCKRRFVKSDGCNKMTCVCGTKMCYLCRKEITDYSHFYNPPQQLPNQPAPVPQPGKCPLYCDTVKVHEEEVAKSAEAARAELASENPNIRVDLILGKK